MIYELLIIYLFFEFINWSIHLFNYIQIIYPTNFFNKKDVVKKIIKRIYYLGKEEIEYIIKCSILYDKSTHMSINIQNFDIKILTRMEIFYFITNSLYCLKKKKLTELSLIEIIYINKILENLENKLNHKFIDIKINRFLYRRWGHNFIKFNFRPLILKIIIYIIGKISYLYFTIILKFNYYKCDQSKIYYLYNISDPNKKIILFIHGFGFGYLPYIQKLFQLNKKYNLIIVTLPNISGFTYYNSFFPSNTIVINSFYNFFTKMNIKNINILSHSFGTYITEIIRKDPRSDLFINKIIMVDPIIFWIGCFKMNIHIDNPYVDNSTYLSYIYSYLINYLIYQCLYLKFICYRLMFGPAFWIYDASEIEDKKILLVLEKHDYVIPTDIIYNKLLNKRVNYYYIDNATHGSVLLDSNFNNSFNDIISFFD
jgi:hypothetical protein